MPEILVSFTRHGACSPQAKLFGFNPNTNIQEYCKPNIKKSGVYQHIKKSLGIKDKDIVVYTSPMRRAQTTASLIFGDKI